MPTITPMLVTADAARLVAFYAELLGATQTERMPPEGDPSYVGLRLGDSALGVVQDAAAAAAPTRTLLSVEVDGIGDLDALVARVEGLGGAVSSPGTDMPWGQRVAHVADPDGNPVNLTQQLGGRLSG